MAFRNPILAGTTLIRDAIQSSNYLAGHAGWRIATSGSAEFNDITIRGASIVGSDQLWYNGTPGAGNLAFAISENGGTDAYGNAYPGGFTAFDLAVVGSDVRISGNSVYYGPANGAGVYASSYTPDSGITLVLNSGAGASPDTAIATLALVPGDPAGASGGTAPHLQVGGGGPSTPGDVRLRLGNVWRTDGAGAVEDWTAATLEPGLTGGTGAGMRSGLFTLQLAVAAHVSVTGHLLTTATVANGSVIATGLPPTGADRAMIPCTSNVSAGGGAWSGCMLFVDSAGQATYYGADLAAGAELYLTGIYPTLGL